MSAITTLFVNDTQETIRVGKYDITTPAPEWFGVIAIKEDKKGFFFYPKRLKIQSNL